MKYRNYKSLDYLSVTLDKVPNWIIGEKYEYLDSIPLKNYNKGYVTELGARVLWSTKNPKVRTHIIMSGDTLALMRGEGHTDIEIAEFFMNYDCRITRVDIQVTSERINGKHHNLNPTRLHKIAHTQGQLISRLSPNKGVIEDRYIETMYIGSRKSRNRLFKAYDKGIDLGIQAKNIIRYELETRKYANVILYAVAQTLDIGGIIRKYVDFPQVALWCEIMNSPSVKIPHIPDPMSPNQKKRDNQANRWYWLMKSVAPAMAKALLEDRIPIENNENLRLFGVHVNNLYNKFKEENHGKIPYIIRRIYRRASNKRYAIYTKTVKYSIRIRRYKLFR